MSQIYGDFESTVQREVEQRIQENLLEWEDEYKSRHIRQLREAVAEDMRVEFEAKL